METPAGQGEHGTGKSVKGSIRKIPSESGIRLWRNFFRYGGLSRLALGRSTSPSAIFKIIVVEGKKKSEPISNLENWFGLYWFGAGNRT